MRRIAIVVGALLVLLTPVPGRALFHVVNIDEVMSGLGGDPTAQYVEIRMLAPTQNFASHSRLTAFNCNGSSSTVLLEVPTDLCNGGTNVRWSMGTASWASATGTTPDFLFPAGIITPCGMICWGAPGILPPNPATWDATMPNNYVDCVTYGGYTGPRQSPCPGGVTCQSTTLAPGNGTMSLQRVAESGGNDLLDFALATRTPTNNGPCPTTTTTSTSTTTSRSTSTTTSTSTSSTTSTTISASYNRPSGAKAFSVAFVKAFNQCGGGTFTHNGPISFGGCTPSTPAGALKFGVKGTGSASGKVVVNSLKQATDVILKTKFGDVRTSANAPFNGNMVVSGTIRITDDYCVGTPNGGCTVSDSPFPIVVPCGTVASPPLAAGKCAKTTSANGVLVGAVVPNKKANVGIQQLQAYLGTNLSFVEGLYLP